MAAKKDKYYAGSDKDLEDVKKLGDSIGKGKSDKKDKYYDGYEKDAAEANKLGDSISGVPKGYDTPASKTAGPSKDPTTKVPEKDMAELKGYGAAISGVPAGYDLPPSKPVNPGPYTQAYNPSADIKALGATAPQQLPPGYAPHVPGRHILDWDGNHIEGSEKWFQPMPAPAPQPAPAVPPPVPTQYALPPQYQGPSGAVAMTGLSPDGWPTIGSAYGLGGSDDELAAAAKAKATASPDVYQFPIPGSPYKGF